MSFINTLLVMRRITLFYKFCMIVFNRKCIFCAVFVWILAAHEWGCGFGVFWIEMEEVVFVVVLMSRRVKGVCDLSPQRLVSVSSLFSFLSFFFKCFPWGKQLSWHENAPGILKTKSTDITDTHTTSVMCTDWYAVIFKYHLWKLIFHFSNWIQLIQII